MEDRSTTSLNERRAAGYRPESEGLWVTALFTDREDAEHAYEALKARGYESDDVNVLMTDDTRKRLFSPDTELGSKATKGAGVGGAVGATVGAIAAAIAAVGTSIVIPGLGLVVAGPLAAALAGAGAGGVTGGLLGALIGAGIPEERVKHYEAGIKSGGILLAVIPRSEEDASYFVDEWTKAGGTHVYR